MQTCRMWRLLSIFGVATCFASIASATQTTSMTLTGVAGPSLGGVYTSPYIATVGGVRNVYVICDDFVSETYLNESWTANMSVSPDLSSAKWSGGWSYNGTTWNKNLTQTQAYTAAAYLVGKILQSLQQNNVPAENDYSYALWALFDGATPINFISGYPSDAAQALTYLKDAETATAGQSLGAGITVYTYDGNGVTGCGGCSPPPQEFLAVSMPEPSYPAVLALDLLAVVGLMVVFRRRLSNIFS